jgi:choline transport protein
MIQGLIVLNDDSYTPERWHSTLLMIGILLVSTLVNTVGARHLAKLEGIILFLHIIGFFAIIIPLWVMGPKNSSKVVFTGKPSLLTYRSLRLER